MAELDLETVERAVRWCAEAGRQCAAAEVRAALGALAWDELLAARALLADPPPARPLGPYALADLARGVPADAAAEREREQRYPRPEAPAEAPVPPPAGPRPAAPERRPGGRKRARPVLIRKAATSAPAAPAPPPPRPLLDELLLPAGRNDLERLIRRHGGRRPHLLAALAATHRRADGAPPGDADLDRLLDHHGLATAFARRERDELRHAVRAAGGVLARAGAAVGFPAGELGGALKRLGLEGEAEALREARRRELRGRATLAERVQLVVSDPERLADLGLLAEFERDLAARLPEHLKALVRQREPVAIGLARTLALPAEAVRDLVARLGVALPAPAPRASAGVRPRRARPSGPRSGRFGAGANGAAPPPPAGARRPARPGPRPMGLRPAGPRQAGPRPAGSRPPGARPVGPRPAGARPADPRPSGPRRPPSSRPGRGRGPGR